MKKILLAAAIVAAPLAARADTGLRLGGEADLAYHNSAGTSAITDNWPVALDLMLSYWTPGSVLSLDLEVSEQWVTKDVPPTQGTRRGTVLRPGIRLSPPAFPLYLRGAIPINIEQPTGWERETFDLRVGAGFNIPLVLFKIYLEADADFPLTSKTNASGGSNISAFNQQAFQIGGGLDFRF